MLEALLAADAPADVPAVLEAVTEREAPDLAPRRVEGGFQGSGEPNLVPDAMTFDLWKAVYKKDLKD